eukprot:IDg18766t1
MHKEVNAALCRSQKQSIERQNVKTDLISYKQIEGIHGRAQVLAYRIQDYHTILLNQACFFPSCLKAWRLRFENSSNIVALMQYYYRSIVLTRQ